MTAQRKSPMAVDKSSTPLWMRVVIIIVAVSFIGMLVPIVLGLGGGTKTPSGNGTGTELFADQYQPRVDAALATLKTNPTNPDIVAQVGHSYYEWAAEIFQSGQQAASIPMWQSAVSYYNQALALRPDDDVVLGNKAFALYYANDVGAAAALEAFIAAAADNAGLASQVENAQGMLAQLASSNTSATTTP